jgi:hypothetical protein
MADIVTTATQVPLAPYYVTSIDTFMSGWGGAAGKTNRIILPCNSLDEADVVAQNAKGRTDQESVEILKDIPRDWFRRSAKQLVQVMHRESSLAWYRPGAFTKGR